MASTTPSPSLLSFVRLGTDVVRRMSFLRISSAVSARSPKIEPVGAGSCVDQLACLVGVMVQGVIG